MRVGDAWITSNSSPRTGTARPALGMRPAHSTSRPATVVDRPDGQRDAEPLLDRLGRDVAVGLEDGRARPAARPRTSSSCSSKISPTSSSSRSSSVTMPSVPPNSSRTTARWRRSRCMSSSRSPQVRLAGVDGHRPDRQRIARAQLEEIEGVQHPDDLVERAAVHRDAAVPALREHRADVLQRRVLLDRDDVGARRHHLAHRPTRERHHAADHHQLVVGAQADRGALAPDRARDRWAA